MISTLTREDFLGPPALCENAGSELKHHGTSRSFTPTQFIEVNGNPHRPDVSAFVSSLLSKVSTRLICIFARRQALAHRRDTSRSLSRARPSRTDMGRHVPILPVDPPLSTQETAKLALAFCGLWFAANWAMNAALGYTSVSSTTILTSMSGKQPKACASVAVI